MLILKEDCWAIPPSNFILGSVFDGAQPRDERWEKLNIANYNTSGFRNRVHTIQPVKCVRVMSSGTELQGRVKHIPHQKENSFDMEPRVEVLFTRSRWALAVRMRSGSNTHHGKHREVLETFLSFCKSTKNNRTMPKSAGMMEDFQIATCGGEAQKMSRSQAYRSLSHVLPVSRTCTNTSTWMNGIEKLRICSNSVSFYFIKHCKPKYLFSIC